MKEGAVAVAGSFICYLYILILNIPKSVAADCYNMDVLMGFGVKVERYNNKPLPQCQTDLNRMQRHR